MRRASRKDLLHGAVGRLFHDHDYDTLDTSNIGDGCPDWLIAFGTFAFMVEVKSPETMSKGRSQRFDEHGRNENQIEFHNRWKSEIKIVSSLEDAWKVLDWANDAREFLTFNPDPHKP